MELSCKVKYALLALLELTNHYQQRTFLQIDQISARHQIPDRYLAQLLRRLRQAGLIHSQRGSKGGYLLAKPPYRITLSEVLTCMEGIPYLEIEEQRTTVTPENAAIEKIWQEATLAAIAVLQQHTLQDLHEKRYEHLRPNSMYYI